MIDVEFLFRRQKANRHRTALEAEEAVHREKPSPVARYVCRAKPLIIGASGCGKTSLFLRVVDTLGERGKSLPFLTINCGSAIPMGAKAEPCTLATLRTFIRSNPVPERGGVAGAIFLDELDKIAPHDRVAYGDSWASSVLTDVYAFLDADTRLLSAGWSQAEIDALSRYFICAAGTWQRHAKPGDASYADRIAGDLLIPEELAFRLNSNFIEVGLPDREDFRSAIQRIYREMDIQIPDSTRLESLIDSAVASRRGMRWIEDLVASILCANPSKIRAQIQRDWAPSKVRFSEVHPSLGGPTVKGLYRKRPRRL